MEEAVTSQSVKAAISDAVGRMKIDSMWKQYAKKSDEINVEALKEKIRECVQDVTPAGITVEIEEESDEMKLIRHIHEEPIEEINMKINMTLSHPVDYIVVTLSGSTDEKFGLKLEQNTGSRDASSSDP